MYKIYYLVSKSTDWYYIGMTKNSLENRFNAHIHSMRRGTKTPLYSCMRKYQDFIPILRAEFDTHEECCEEEIRLIAEAKELGHNVLNLADGGNGGFVVPEDKIDSWKRKLRKKRRGRKPALGMKHTEENKKIFSKVSKEYWATQVTYSAEAISKCSSFKEAHDVYGISKTHYYRLKRQSCSE